MRSRRLIKKKNLTYLIRLVPFNAKMIAVQDPRMTQSKGNSPNTMLMEDELERSLRNSANLPLRTIFTSSEFIGRDVQDDVEALAHALECNGDGPPYVRVRGQEPTLAPSKSVRKLLDNTKLRVKVRQMVHEKVERIRNNRVKETMSIAADKAHSDIFNIGFVSANDGFKPQSFHFAEDVFGDIGTKRGTKRSV